MTDDQSKRGSFLAVVFTVFSRLNAGGGGGGGYLKLGLVDPAFIRTRRLFIKCIFQPSIF